jgi:prepilin-type N-terminal cleavage/methylation domain-containing protein
LTLLNVLCYDPDRLEGRSATGADIMTNTLQNRRTAFTLIELLAVMTVILILAAMVLYTARYVTEKAQRSKAEAYIKQKCAEMEEYYAREGRYPFDQEGQWCLGTDPWGTNYFYEPFSTTGAGYVERQQYVIYSYGPNMRPGDEANTNWGDGDDIVMGNYGRLWGRHKE